MDFETRVKSSAGPKACITCAKAKSRCNPGPVEGICERCHRLRKSCSAQSPAPLRKRRTPKPTRIGELEKRLQNLAASVESRNTLASSVAQVELPTETEARPPKIRRFSFQDFRGSRRRPGYSHIFPVPNSPEVSDQQTREEGPENPSQESPSSQIPMGKPAQDQTMAENDMLPRRRKHHLSSQPAPDPTSTSVPRDAQPQETPVLSARSEDPWYYPSLDEAQRFIEDYGNFAVPLFPFIVLSPTTTSQALRRDRPLLWKAIMTQGLYMRARRQVLMGEALLHDVVTAAFLQTRKSLDLLQAIEVFVAWFHSASQSFQLTNLLFLMRSICVSLGFNESQEFSKQENPSMASLEQMRAFTGVYYLVTMVFTTNKKPDAFMNVTYLDHCCRTLEAKMEYPSDHLAVLLVRTQRLSQSISMTLALRNRDSMPLSLIVQSFQHEIRQLKIAVPEALGDNAVLTTQIHIAETLLYEVGINEDLTAGLAPTERLALLWECLVAARSMLEARFEKKLDGVPRTTNLTSLDFIYALLVCLKLSLLQLPGWDLHVVRKEIEFDKYVMLQIQILKDFTAMRSHTDTVDRAGDSSKGASQHEPFQDPYVRLLTRLSQLRTSILAELAATLPPDTQQLEESESLPQDATFSNEERAMFGPDMWTTFGEAFSDDLLEFSDPFWSEMQQVSFQNIT